MKNRYELFSIFQSFFNEIKNQFRVSIRILRCDNACEYLSHSFNTFMKSRDILHQTSCAYTPQQNRVAECKNRHLVETTRALLIHGGVPQRFWGDAILSACYLSNGMTSSILNNKIPHSILFPHEPLHLLPLKVIGSSCFVHNFGSDLDKLSARSHKCVFLGFTKSQKGYINVSQPLLIVTSFLQMSHLLSLLFILSLYLLHLCLHLIKYIFQLSLILQLCLVYLKIPLIYHLLRFIVIIRLLIIHLMTLFSYQLFYPLRVRQLNLIFPLSFVKVYVLLVILSTFALSYHRLSQPFYTCLLSISSVSIPKIVADALAHPS